MKNINSIYILLIIVYATIFGCQNIDTPQSNSLAKAKAKLEQATSIHYDYQSIWDNRFNETSLDFDSIQVIYSEVDSSIWGYGFYAKKGNYEFVFDGVNCFEIDHAEETIIFNDREEIQADSTYFESTMFFAINPLDLLEVDSLQSISQAFIKGQKMEVYQTRVIEYGDDDNRKIQRDDYYFIDPTKNELHQIKGVSIVNEDTVQIIDHHFTNYIFADTSFDFTQLDNAKTITYQAQWENDYEQARLEKQVKVGTQLAQQTYVDIENQAIELYGNSARQSLIMFSFIGCGGCEVAMRDFIKREYKIKSDIDLMYSSPVDKQSTLKKYLTKQEFPFKGFAKESKMNEDFSIFMFPTFVLVDSGGKVKEVIEGYDETTKELLFGK
ncbi:MAG: hypothetical protein AAF573_05500 [Bacteroidota bacterium]